MDTGGGGEGTRDNLLESMFRWCPFNTKHAQHSSGFFSLIFRGSGPCFYPFHPPYPTHSIMCHRQSTENTVGILNYSLYP